MSDEIRAQMQTAREALREAEQLLSVNLPRGAASRAYYAMFHAASAMLASKGERYSSHEAVKGRFGELFSKTRQVDPTFHRYLLEGFELRHEADYVVRPETATYLEKAGELVRKAVAFVGMAERFLQQEEKQ